MEGTWTGHILISVVHRLPTVLLLSISDGYRQEVRENKVTVLIISGDVRIPSFHVMEQPMVIPIRRFTISVVPLSLVLLIHRPVLPLQIISKIQQLIIITVVLPDQ